MPSYPYISGQGAVVQTFSQLRKGFPGKVDAGYLKRFNIAPANESYVISILRFLGLIDEDGVGAKGKINYFFGNDETFKSGLEDTLRLAYSQLFDEMGDEAFTAHKDDLTHWFRTSDKTSDLVGGRQASTFQTLAALAGHGDLPSARSAAAKKASAGSSATAPKRVSAKSTPSSKPASKVQVEKPVQGQGNASDGKVGQDVGLTVRIEVNLPPGGDADTYDAIFASIKKHLMS